METRTYYEILGVSREATLEEITASKNALAKVYHPDANMGSNIDTTSYMQEILEAYRILSVPDKRKQYDLQLSGGTERIFRTYTVENPQPGEESKISFATYWNAAYRLYELVAEGASLMDLNTKKEGLPARLLKKLGRRSRYEAEITEQLAALAMNAVQCITTLKIADIPMDYWQPDAMNWVLVRWGQKQNMDYHVLFSKYDAYIEQNKTGTERLKLHAQNRQFHNSLKKLLNYAVQP